MKTKTIYKFPLSILDEQKIKVPFATKIICVNVQNGIPTIWVELWEDFVFDCEISIFVVPTGGKLPAADVHYIGTVLMLDGKYVWHFYAGDPYPCKP